MKRKMIILMACLFMWTGMHSIAAADGQKENLQEEDAAVISDEDSSLKDSEDPNYQYVLDLQEYDIFKGTGKGLELGRKPTRLEGAVMFVRLLGKESEALEKCYTHPFTDVPDWGSPYVGYLYQSGLTKGISDILFGSNEYLDLKSYLTFILRCLGYDDGAGDFEWETVESKAEEVNLVDQETIPNLQFTRSDLAKISAMALDAQIKNSDKTLAEFIKMPGSDAYYVLLPIKMTEDNWLTVFLGGMDQQIGIHLGKLVHTVDESLEEFYIDLIGNNQFITLAANGGRYDYYEDTHLLKRVTIDFLTGRRFDGTKIVKEYSEGLIHITLIIEYDQQGKSTPVVLYCGDYNEFFDNYPKSNYYEIYDAE